MEQVSFPPDQDRAGTSAASDDASQEDSVATVPVSEVVSIIEASVAPAADRAAVDRAAAAAVMGVVDPPVGAAAMVAGIAAGNMAASNFGPRDQWGQAVPMAAAATLVNIGTPFAEIGQWHKNLISPWVNPVQPMITDMFGFSRMWERMFGFSRMWERQQSLFSSLTGSSLYWGDDLNLWPTDGLMTGVFRSLDVARPRLFDMSSTLHNLLGSARWLEPFGTDLWRDLRHAGARIAYWAVEDAFAALARGDFRALKEFIFSWLDAHPTSHRVEALVEALLEIDTADYRPSEGHQLLEDLARLVRRRTTVRRRHNETVLGMRRGHGGTITVLGREDLTVAHHLGHHDEPPLEDGVLNRIQPDVDPRVVELVNTLPYPDRRIAMLKIATGCAWSEAATQSGAPASQGEVVRRRLSRHRAALPYTTDPWTDLGDIAAQGAPVGRLRPDVVIIDGATGIYP